jgi:hypothetical protein
MDNNKDTIAALYAEVKDVSKPEQERRAALKHIARLRNEPEHHVNSIPVEDLASVAAAVAVPLQLGIAPLRMIDAAEAREQGRAQRGISMRRR